MSEIGVQINGQGEQIPTETSLADLLRSRRIEPATARGIAVAVNEVIVRRAEWSSKSIQDGDAIEIVTARQGG